MLTFGNKPAVLEMGSQFDMNKKGGKSVIVKGGIYQVQCNKSNILYQGPGMIQNPADAGTIPAPTGKIPLVAPNVASTMTFMETCMKVLIGPLNSPALTTESKAVISQGAPPPYANNKSQAAMGETTISKHGQP